MAEGDSVEFRVEEGGGGAWDVVTGEGVGEAARSVFATVPAGGVVGPDGVRMSSGEGARAIAAAMNGLPLVLAAARRLECVVAEGERLLARPRTPS